MPSRGRRAAAGARAAAGGRARARGAARPAARRPIVKKKREEAERLARGAEPSPKSEKPPLDLPGDYGGTGEPPAPAPAPPPAPPPAPDGEKKKGGVLSTASRVLFGKKKAKKAEGSPGRATSRRQRGDPRQRSPRRGRAEAADEPAEEEEEGEEDEEEEENDDGSEDSGLGEDLETQVLAAMANGGAREPSPEPEPPAPDEELAERLDAFVTATTDLCFRLGEHERRAGEACRERLALSCALSAEQRSFEESLDRSLREQARLAELEDYEAADAMSVEVETMKREMALRSGKLRDLCLGDCDDKIQLARSKFERQLTRLAQRDDMVKASAADCDRELAALDVETRRCDDLEAETAAQLDGVARVCDDARDELVVAARLRDADAVWAGAALDVGGESSELHELRVAVAEAEALVHDASTARAGLADDATRHGDTASDLRRAKRSFAEPRAKAQLRLTAAAVALVQVELATVSAGDLRGKRGLEAYDDDGDDDDDDDEAPEPAAKAADDAAAPAEAADDAAAEEAAAAEEEAREAAAEEAARRAEAAAAAEAEAAAKAEAEAAAKRAAPFGSGGAPSSR
ncbi:hypothetical protein JL720_3534 [Aureococcus anophagefferens]|nr:hypothetical protein JL720_3534 [Aureococcus anophagefferens]